MKIVEVGDMKKVSIGPGTDFLISYGLQEPVKIVVLDVLPNSLVVISDAAGDKPFLMTPEEWYKL